MNRELRFTSEADTTLSHLETDPARAEILKQVRKTLGLLEINLRHPGLKTHEFSSMKGLHGERIWEAYAKNKTPGAYSVFFHFGSDEERDGNRIPILTIFAITPHP